MLEGVWQLMVSSKSHCNSSSCSEKPSFAVSCCICSLFNPFPSTGFGHVGLVEHKSTGGVFALKWVPREPCKDACLKSEIQLLSGLSNPFVGKYVKHFLWQGSTYMLQVRDLRILLTLNDNGCIGLQCLLQGYPGALRLVNLPSRLFRLLSLLSERDSACILFD